MNNEDSLNIDKAYYSPLMSLNTYVIDNVCVKNRSGNTDLSALEINNKVENYEGIAIQQGKELDIYCRTHSKKAIEESILKESNKGSIEYKAYKNGLIRLHELNVDVKDLYMIAYNEALALLDYYYVDGECIKNRYDHIESMSEERMNMAVDSYSNIGVQESSLLNVYCDESVKDRLLKRIKGDNGRLSEAYITGVLNIHTK